MNLVIKISWDDVFYLEVCFFFLPHNSYNKTIWLLKNAVFLFYINLQTFNFFLAFFFLFGVCDFVLYKLALIEFP